MKTTKIHITILLSMFLLGFISCNTDDDDNKNQGTPVTPAIENPDAFLYADYVNNGTAQTLTIDYSQTTPLINIEGTSTITPAPMDRLDFTFTGVTFTEGNAVFRVNQVQTENQNTSGNWVIDSENFLSQEFSKSLDIVLVLDVSSSLGQNVNNVKSYAVEFVDDILTSNQEAKIAVVKFSEGFVNTIFSSNYTFLSNFIQENTSFNNPNSGSTYELEGRNATDIYEAMLTGIDLLQNSSSRGQAIITFTDGTHNYQLNPNNADPLVVINELNQSQIRSYTIGFNGNQNSVDGDILSNLAVNGNFREVNSLVELEQVFIDFSNTVSAVYDLTYNVNNSTFNGTKKLRFSFDLTQISP